MSPLSRINSKSVITTLSLLGILGVFLLISYYIAFVSDGYLHSDYSDTILWAQATFDSGELVYDGFRYAAILPFGGNLLMLIFMPFFGYSMTTHTLGMLTFLLLLVLAIVWFCRGLGYGYGRAFVLTAMLALILSSSEKLREIMWGHIIYYSLGILFFLFGFGLISRIIEKQEDCIALGAPSVSSLATSKKCIVLFAIGFVFSLCTALNGLQSLLTYILPILFGLFFEALLNGEKKHFSSRLTLSSILFISMLIATLLGLLLRGAICGEVGSAYADAYSSYSDMDEWMNNLLLFPTHYFELLGVSVKEYDPIADINSLFTMIKLFGGILLLILPFYLLFTYKKIQKRSVKILTVSHFALSAMLLYAYIFGLLSTANWRLTPLIASLVITSFAALCELWDRREAVGKRIAALCLALLLALSAIPMVTIAKTPKDYGEDNALHLLASGLEERGLSEGYATFWNSQAITLLSDNEVRARNISVSADGIKRETYQSQYAWYESEDLDVSCFLLLSEYENLTLYRYFAEEGADYNEHFTIGSYHVYVYSRNILKGE